MFLPVVYVLTQNAIPADDVNLYGEVSSHGGGYGHLVAHRIAGVETATIHGFVEIVFFSPTVKQSAAISTYIEKVL